MWKQLTCALLVITGACAAVGDFPPPIEKCHINDEPCMIKQANAFIRSYANGLPERGIPPLEPLEIERIEVLGDKNSPAHFDLVLTDVKLYNYSKNEITHLKFKIPSDINKPIKAIILSQVDKLVLKSKYKADGQVLVLPFKGEGDLVWTLSGVSGKTIVLFKRETRDDGKVYLTVTDYKVNLKLKNFHTSMTNLFNGDKLLSDNLQQVINDNWQVLGDDIMNACNKALGDTHAAQLNKFLKDVPLENYFLPNENAVKID